MSNPVRGRLNAGFFRLVDRYVHRVLGERKAPLFADLPAPVVEIRPGTKANLRYYRPGTRIVAVEPNVHMHAALRRGARRHGISWTCGPSGPRTPVCRQAASTPE